MRSRTDRTLYVLQNAVMKVAVVFSIPSTTTEGFAWRWRSEDQKQESSKSFPLYGDCLADAKRHGYGVKPVYAQGLNAPSREFRGDLA